VQDAGHAVGRRPGAWRVAGAGAALLLVAGYCAAASGTRPFSTGADVATAVPYAVVGAVMVRTLWRRPARRRSGAVPWRTLRPWLAALGVCCMWELVTYVAGSGGDRHGWPTASSLLDLADRTRAAKAVVFAAWLALGWGLVRR